MAQFKPYYALNLLIGRVFISQEKGVQVESGQLSIVAVDTFNVADSDSLLVLLDNIAEMVGRLRSGSSAMPKKES